MARTLAIEERTSDPTINLCLDTLSREKQALVFCSTKRGAESQAEKVAGKSVTTEEGRKLADTALGALSSATKQCRRLARCLAKGVAFHHAGLHAKQRQLVEDGFRKGNVKIICSTPTLAMGLDLPAFRVVIRDLKRFGGSWGLTDIPVLEYAQMAGRAGRPGKEEYGEAVVLAQTPEEMDERTERYLLGSPEHIFSKLAVEPVLRTYVLSLIAGGFVASRGGLHAFFDRTFYAAQYQDTGKMHAVLDAMAAKLVEWGFLGTGKSSEFVSASALAEEKLEATPMGKRVAELYLDPFTAHFLVVCLHRAAGPEKPMLTDFSALHMLASCLELRPLLRPRAREIDTILESTNAHIDTLLAPEPVRYSEEYEEFLMTLKTALFFQDWIGEVQEDALLEKYGITPGEVHAKLERADWLVYATEELCRLLSLQRFRAPLARLRLRLRHGAKEELLPLLRLRNIGRVRARKLYSNSISSLQDVKDAEASALAALVGKQVALDLKRQVGQELAPEKVQVPPRKRKGQKSMMDYG